MSPFIRRNDERRTVHQGTKESSTANSPGKSVYKSMSLIVDLPRIGVSSEDRYAKGSSHVVLMILRPWAQWI